MYECPFCKIASGKINAWKVLETETTIAFLDLDPVAQFHTLVIPKQHFSDIFSIPESVLYEVMSIVKRVCVLYQEKLDISNIQILNNSGILAQQSVFHVHFHILPRFPKDGNNIYLMKRPELVKHYEEFLNRLK